MRGNVMVLTWGMWVAISAFSSSSVWAEDLPGPALDVPVDVDGDGISSLGDVWVFNWWLSQGASLKEVLASAQVHDGLLDLSEYFSEREASTGAGGGAPGILGATSSCNWSTEEPSTTRMPPNWMTTDLGEPNGLSDHARITPSGCFVVFSSAAGNLEGASPDGFRQIFRLEYRNGQPYELQHVSAMAGTGSSADGNCYRPSISDDGNLVAFESEGGMNLPGERNRGLPGVDLDDRDIFVRDVAGQTTQRVSQNPVQQAPDAPCYYASISGDGAWVAFTSEAKDFGEEYEWDGLRHVFRAITDAPAGAECVSVADNGAGQDVLPGGDMQTAETVTGVESVGHVISPNGAVTAFHGITTNWPDWTTQNPIKQVFVRDLTNPEDKKTFRVSHSGPPEKLGHARSPSLSPVPRPEGWLRIAFSSLYYDVYPHYEDIFASLLDPSDGTVTFEKISKVGQTHGNRNSVMPNISRSGLYVAFASHAFNLVPGDTNACRDVFLKRHSWPGCPQEPPWNLPEAIRRSSVRSDGSQAGGSGRDSRSPDVTEDGAVVVFESTKTDLLGEGGDENDALDVFRRYEPWLTRFVRGDANDDGDVNISDAIFILSYLFQGGPEPHCLDSADTDDTGELNLTDGVYLLNYLQSGGPEPPPPFPECGTDYPPGQGGHPMPDTITCNSFQHCQQN